MSHSQRAPRSALSESVEAFFSGIGVGAAGVGTASTSVLRFVAGNTVIASPYIDVDDDAAEGTLIHILTPGVYTATLALQQVASSDIVLGISIGFAATTPITGAPVIGSQGVIATLPVSTLAAATTMGHQLSRTFVVPDEDPGTPTAPGARALLRFRAGIGAGTTPIPAIVVASAWASVVRICDAAA